ncbi:MAG: hypothetical protein LBB36_04070 [Fibromonadaceae bacterium]|jgi:hypothetical protein|nr:hypothetical protein [Fibromonadaceae bacterium]
MKLKLISKIAINALIAAGLFFSMPFAQETDARQKAVISALDSIEENTVGFSLNGRAKGGLISSKLSSEALPDGEDISDYSAFTDFLLNISVRPSNETKASFDLRFHKDWQSAYREGNNTPIVRWWSYDGNILDKRLKFNLGTMRVAYTPLTIYLPEPDLVMEPEIFAEQKKEAMEERYLDGTNRRLLQGLNLEYKTEAGMFDRIFMQGTIVRLRKVADGKDRIFFDFDPNKDRFSMAARIGVETFGLSMGVNDVYTFNRFSSSLKNIDTLDYEKNNVLSFELSYNSKKLFPGPLAFGVGAEYALSEWSWWQHAKVQPDQERVVNFVSVSVPYSVGPTINASGTMGNNYYPYYTTSASKTDKYELFLIKELDKKGALLANAFVSYSENTVEAKLSGHFLNTDKDFEAELAASPAYLPNLSILNSNTALEHNLQMFRTGSLENMYYSLYYTLPLNAISIVQSNYVGGTPGIPYSIVSCMSAYDEITTGVRSMYQMPCLANNYKLAHYYRNAYTQQTLTRNERPAPSDLDPAVNLALPYGYATPDRAGGDADFNFAWNKAVTVRGVFGMYSSEEGINYKRFGGGMEIDIARLAGLSTALSLSGSYEKNKEEKGVYNPQIDRIMAGTKIGIWRGLSLIGGFHKLTKEFENPYLGFVDKTGETLLLGGPQVKISERANFSLQGGLLSNSIEGMGEKLDLEKYIMSGIVTVEF